MVIRKEHSKIYKIDNLWTPGKLSRQNYQMTELYILILCKPGEVEVPKNLVIYCDKY